MRKITLFILLLFCCSIVFDHGFPSRALYAVDWERDAPKEPEPPRPRKEKPKKVTKPCEPSGDPSCETETKKQKE